MYKDVIQTLTNHGYAFVTCWQPDLSTQDVATKLGNVLDISKLLPHSGISNIQALKPREQSTELNNQYSGAYGLGHFPLHTDLAHWQRPPRYILLRCIIGSPAVATVVIPSIDLFSELDETTLKRAVVRPRKKNISDELCVLPVVYSENDMVGVRWDSLFLVPMNEAAKRVNRFIASYSWDNKRLNYEYLSQPGDTLIIDNWRMLHGRSAVQQSEKDRLLERAYLSDISE
jgi:L-asparagine oxygenase